MRATNRKSIIIFVFIGLLGLLLLLGQLSELVQIFECISVEPLSQSDHAHDLSPKLIWQVGNADNGWEVANAIDVCRNGDIVAAGQASCERQNSIKAKYNRGIAVVVARYRSNGQLKWQKKITEPDVELHVSDLVVLASNRIVLAGWKKESNSASMDNEKAWIFEVAPNGDAIKQGEVAHMPTGSSLLSAARLSGDSFVSGGYFNDAARSHHFGGLLISDSFWSIGGTLKYGKYGIESFRSIRRLSADKIIALASTRQHDKVNNVKLMTINMSGKIVGDGSVKLCCNNARLSNIALQGGSGFALAWVCPNMNLGEGKQKGFLRLYDENRSLMWTKSVDAPDQPGVLGLAEIPGGGFLLVDMKTHLDKKSEMPPKVRWLDADGAIVSTWQFEQDSEAVITAVTADSATRAIMAGYNIVSHEGRETKRPWVAAVDVE